MHIFAPLIYLFTSNEVVVASVSYTTTSLDARFTTVLPFNCIYERVNDRPFMAAPKYTSRRQWRGRLPALRNLCPLKRCTAFDHSSSCTERRSQNCLAIRAARRETMLPPTKRTYRQTESKLSAKRISTSLLLTCLSN